MTDKSLFDRWLIDAFQPQPLKPEIKLMWEVLPSPSGQLHAVDPDPDAIVDSYPVSLCGKMLISKGGVADTDQVCAACVEISKERQAEFDAEASV